MARFIVDVANVKKEDIKSINAAITNGITEYTQYRIVTANCIDETNDNQFMEFDEDNNLNAKQILETFVDSSNLIATIDSMKSIIGKFEEFKSDKDMSDKIYQIVNRRFKNIGELEYALCKVFGFPIYISANITNDKNHDDKIGDDELHAELKLVGMTAGDLTLYYIKDRHGNYFITDIIHI